jgi:hypothetical protein
VKTQSREWLMDGEVFLEAWAFSLGWVGFPFGRYLTWLLEVLLPLYWASFFERTVENFLFESTFFWNTCAACFLSFCFFRSSSMSRVCCGV